MSYFGTALTTIMQRNGLKQIDLAKQSGVDNSNVSRYCTGDQVWVSPDHLEKLARAISTKAEDRAELIKAHLLDECVGPGSDLIDISIRDGAAHEARAPYHVPLPQELEDALNTIRESLVHDRNVREIIEGLANLLKHGDPRTNDERTGLVEDTVQEIVDEVVRGVKAEGAASAHSAGKSGKSGSAAANPQSPSQSPPPSGASNVSYRRHSRRKGKPSDGT